MLENKNNLNDMMSEASAEIKDNHLNKKSKKKVIISSVIGVVVIALIVISATTLMKFNSNENMQKGEVISGSGQSAQSHYQGQSYPVNVPEWAKVPYLLTSEDGLTFFADESRANDAIDWAKYSNGGEIAKILPSRASGYTNDVKDMLTETGALNLYFSYILEEDIEYALATYTHRLINPTFGGWGEAQEHESNPKENMPIGALRDMFTEKWLSENITENDYSKLPVLADWSGELAKKFKLTQGEDPKAHFFGEVSQEAITGTTAMNTDGSVASISYTVPVTFKAFSDTNELHVVEGVLTMTLVPNGINEEDEVKHNDFEHRLLIDSASLTLS